MVITNMDNIIEPNFTVAFLLIRKTWDGCVAGTVGGWKILKNGGDPIMGYDIEMEGGDISLWTTTFYIKV